MANRSNNRGHGAAPRICPHGNLGIAKCKQCNNDKTKRWYQRNREAQRARCKQNRLDNLEAHRAYDRKRWHDNPNDLHAKKFKESREHPERFRKRLGIPGGSEIRHGKCAMRGCLYEGRLVPDHNHETGQMRDWICRYCNFKLGAFETYFRKGVFVEYLTKWDEQAGVKIA